jgi:3D (Asp-Asp-Asp) domain-containing protein
MRINRLIGALLVTIIVMNAKTALASNTINTDTNIKNETSLISTIFPTQLAMSDAKHIFTEKSEKVVTKTEEEIKYEATLEAWKKKQADKWANLPAGEFTINASAYTASADECGNSKGITASGIKVKENRTIACPPQFPFGAKIKIADMGTYVCEDRGGAIKGNHIDIYVETKTEAFAFGRQNLVAMVVE